MDPIRIVRSSKSLFNRTTLFSPKTNSSVFPTTVQKHTFFTSMFKKVWRFFVRDRKPEPVYYTVKEPIPLVEYNLETLSQFDGVTKSNILISVCGVVHDVTYGSRFYGKNGRYFMLAGKEVGLAFANNSYEDANLNQVQLDTETLDEDQKESLLDYQYMFRKYPIVGYLKEWKTLHPSFDPNHYQQYSTKVVQKQN